MDDLKYYKAHQTNKEQLTSPSIVENLNLNEDEEVETTFVGSTGLREGGKIPEGTNFSTPPPPLEDTKCQIRRGSCQKHQLKARKTVIKSRKWGKKKDGFGWIYTSKVSYMCRLETQGREVSQNSTLAENSDHDRSVILNINEQCNDVGISRQNFLECGSSEGISGGRTSQD